MDDRQDLEAWAAGSREAGEAFVEHHYDAVVRFFRNKAGEAADDLVQRTFVACVEAAPRYRGEGSARAFVFGVARNVLHEHVRGRVRDGRAEPDFHSSALADLAPGVATQAARRADQRVLLAALQRIPLELQVLVELYYWEDLGVDDLARVLEIPAGTVKSRLHRARALLREAIAGVSVNLDDARSAQALLDAWAARVVAERPDGPETP